MQKLESLTEEGTCGCIKLKHMGLKHEIGVFSSVWVSDSCEPDFILLPQQKEEGFDEREGTAILKSYSFQIKAK